MAEVVVSTAVKHIGHYLLQQAPLLLEVRDEVQWLERELAGLLSFLKDADSKRRDRNERVKNWVTEIRDVAYDAEDVIETFMLDSNHLPSIGCLLSILTNCSVTAPLANIMQLFSRCIPTVKSTFSCWKVSKDIKKLRIRIKEASDRRNELGIVGLSETEVLGRNSVYEKLQARRRLPSHYDDPNIIGFERDKKEILNQLFSNKKRRCVVSIVGMGGLGKTTLARKVYHSSQVKEKIGFRVWVSVSQDCRISELLKSIMEAVPAERKKDTGDLGDDKLKEEVYKSLKSLGRYLIVMDDVWKKEVWDQIQTALPDYKNGSRVILTTRSLDVAKAAESEIDPYELPLLNRDDSRKLFLKQLYPHQSINNFGEDLEEVGDKLVHKCQGLPLALVVLGGLVLTKQKNRRQWSLVLDTLNWRSAEDGALSGILGMSYEGLSYDLKPCFLYIATFHEDSEIDARQLMRLWLAEGFVTLGGESREEMAEVFLEELVQRCMVQVDSRRWDDSIKKIRIHDLLRDFCIREAEECRFLHVKSPSNMMSTRRLALYDKKIAEYIDPSTKKWKAPSLRTLLCFNLSENADISYNGLKLLRVVDMRLDVPRANLPKDIASMIHLRYLRWWAGEYSPVDYQIIENLHSLQTLDVRPSILNCDESIGAFKQLQFLGEIEAGMWIGSGLAELTNLEKLVIKNLEDSHWKALIESLEKLQRLISLSLAAKRGCTMPAAITISCSQQQSICFLKLEGMFFQRKQLHDFMKFPPNLTKLTLRSSSLQEDPMTLLKDLPKLMYLKLRSAYTGKRMACQAGGFARLRTLKLDFLSRLEDWRVDVAALPSLTHLAIKLCPNLMKLPEGLQNVTTLQELKLSRMPPQFSQRVHAITGEDRNKVRHIPSIIIN